MKLGLGARILAVVAVAVLSLGAGFLMPLYPLAGLGLPVAVLLGWYFYRRNELGMLLLQDALPLIVVPIGWFVPLPAIPFSLPFIALWALAFAWRMLAERRPLRLEWGLGLMVLFTALCLVSYLTVSDHSPYANNKIYLALTIDIFGFIGAASFKREQYPRVFAGLMIVGLMVAVWTYQAYFAGEQTMAGRYSHLGQNPISTGRLVFAGAFAALVLAPWKPLGLAYFAFVFPPAIWSGSRGPLLGMLVASGLLFFSRFLSPGKLTKRRTRLAALVGAGLLLGASALGGGSPALAEGATRDLGDSSTADTRNAYYMLALEGFASSPVWGLGLGGFAPLIDPVLYGEEVSYPHNMLLEIACELGLIGLLVMFALLWHYLKLSVKLMRYARARPDDPLAKWGVLTSTVFLSFLVACQFSGDLVANHALFFYMGLMTGVETQQRRRDGLDEG